MSLSFSQLAALEARPWEEGFALLVFSGVRDEDQWAGGRAGTACRQLDSQHAVMVHCYQELMEISNSR